MSFLDMFKRVPIPPGGRWVRIDPKDTLEINVVGTPEKFDDKLSRKLEWERVRVVSSISREVSPTVRGRVTVETLIETRLGGVRGLFHDKAKTQPVTLDEFKVLLRDPNFVDLAGFLVNAVNRVDALRESDLTEDEPKTEGEAA